MALSFLSYCDFSPSSSSTLLLRRRSSCSKTWRISRNKEEQLQTTLRWQISNHSGNSSNSHKTMLLSKGTEPLNWFCRKNKTLRIYCACGKMFLCALKNSRSFFLQIPLQGLHTKAFQINTKDSRRKGLDWPMKPTHRAVKTQESSGDSWKTLLVS